MLATSATRRARTVAQVLQQEPGRLGSVGDICMAMVLARTDMFEPAWALFAGARLDEVLRLAAPEYFRVGFTVQPGVASRTLDAVIRGETTVRTDATGWFDIACVSLLAGSVDQSRYALRAAEARWRRSGANASKGSRRAARRLAEWHARAERSSSTIAPAEISVGVLAYRSPDRNAASRNLGHYLESLAALSHLARRDAAFTGDADLVAVADELRERVQGQVTASRPSPAIRLSAVDRDASRWSAVPDGTWLVYAGLLPQALFRLRADYPLDGRLRPLYLSVHVNSAEQLTPDALAHLRRYAPIGCRDWPTTLLLLAADVPAFFAGALTSTLNGVAVATRPQRSGRLFVDVDPQGEGSRVSQDLDTVRTASPAENLRAALGLLDDYRARQRVTSSRLQSYLAARAVGTDARLAPQNPAERRFDGLDALTDAEFAAMQRALTDRIGAVLDAVLAGSDEDEVYALWRQLCAADVAAAQARRADVPPMPASTFNIAAACATIRRSAVTLERSEPGPGGAEINVELSLDGNYRHQLDVVLDSIVFHTSRDVRAFILCRDLVPADHKRLAALFPTVSFEWLPTDRVDYGAISGLLGYTTVATMDRLLLPDLLPHVSRIVHHDLDALCISDLAELFDIDLAGSPVAGVASPLPNLASGFAAFIRQAERFRNRPELGRELLRRTHGRHTFDFQILNAGIMVLDLDVMRADQFGRDFVPYVERFGMNDQAVINVYAGGNRVETHPGWNWRPWLERADDPKIAHWAGRYKPWSRPWVFGKPLWQEAEARVRARYGAAGLPTP